MRVRGQAAGFAVVVGLVLSGCTADADPAAPSAEAKTTAAATPSPSLTPSPAGDLTAPPERPAAISTPSADGAAAAASYFISLYPYVYATGDLTEWNALAGASCMFCSSTRDGATEDHRLGHRIEGGGITIESADGTEIDANRWYSATLIAVQAASTKYDASGAVLEETPSQRHRVFVAMSTDAGAWNIDGVESGRLREPGPSLDRGFTRRRAVRRRGGQCRPRRGRLE